MLTVDIDFTTYMYQNKKISDKYFPSDIYAKPHFLFFVKVFKPEEKGECSKAKEYCEKFLEVLLPDSGRKDRRFQVLLHFDNQPSRGVQVPDWYVWELLSSGIQFWSQSWEQALVWKTHLRRVYWKIHFRHASQHVSQQNKRSPTSVTLFWLQESGRNRPKKAVCRGRCLQKTESVWRL